ncbi:MAG TPA: PAS domain S-box protein, partial [Usitatibacter sp.]|nr:PAS domain S-box protein [Usitatibacter sp.]
PRSNEMLLATFEQAGVGIALIALDGYYTDVNDKFASIVGYTPEELRSRRYSDITHPADLDASRSYVAELLAQRVREVVQEKRYVRRDGSLVWSRTSVSLMKDATGPPQRLISVIQDITVQKQAEEALRGTAEMNRGIIEASRDCIKMLSLEGDLLWMSQAGLQAFCIDDIAAVLGKSWIGLWSGEERAAAEAAVQAAREGGTGAMVGRYDVANETHWWEVVVTPIRDPEGRPERLLAVSRDITERVKAEEERTLLLESERAARAAAERANRIKDEFLATLSHELRTPLAAILGWTHVLRSGAAVADLPRGLEAIERNARMQTQLIEELLDMSRIMSGKMRLDMQPTDPAVFAEAAFETARHAAELKGVQLSRQLVRDACLVHADAHRLQQAVLNLLSNAIKFTPADGRVGLTLHCDATHAVVRVVDTGIGIPPEFLPHVFERFRQADGTMARRHGGLGLGLSIARHVVEMHGGTIEASSPGQDLGATFTIRLPLAAAAPSRQRTRTRAEWPDDFRVADLSGLHVLVVDDDDDGRELVRRLIAECGAEVELASSGAEALQAVRARRPAVMVSDIGMPGMDGYEMMRRLRETTSSSAPLPAIALTAFARPEDRERALACGFAAHVAKPVEPAELVATVARLAGRDVRLPPHAPPRED